jgi:glycosyltransferase involved in cell wall biosynthesis
MQAAPEVTVIIPTRSRWSFLSRTLRSALGQEGVDLEVIVVDDGSRDETPMRLAEIADPRLSVIRRDRSGGVAAARNTALSTARGAWLAPLDDDDLWAPGKLRAQLEAAAREGGSFAYCRSVLIDQHGAAMGPDDPPPDPTDLPRALLVRNCIPGGASNLIASTDLVRELGGFDEGARFDDWDLYIRLAAAGRGARCEETLVAYRRHPGNRILADLGDLTADLEYLARKHRRLSLEHGVEFDRLSFSRTLAWAHRRAGRRREAARMYLRDAWRYRSPGNLVRAAASLLGDWRSHAPKGAKQDFPDWLAQG